MKYGSLRGIPQFYNVLRFALLQQKTRGQKLLLLAKVADLLEQDRHAYYPDEPPVIVGTFEEALLDLITQK